MFELQRSITVTASPLQAWTTLTDFAGFEGWHPYVRLSGPPEVGATMGYSFRTKGIARMMTADAVVTRASKPSEIGWRTGIRGIFILEETYEIHPLPDGSSIVHGLRCTGILAVVARRAFSRRLTAMMTENDEALARRLRHRSAPSSRSNRLQRRTAARGKR